METAVTVEDLHKTYARGAERVKVFDGLHLDLAKGSITALTGPSGSGKSTLLNLIAGFDKPDSGRICVNNFEVSAASSQEMDSARTSFIGFIFQQFYLVPGLTALENVELALYPANVRSLARRKRAKEALAAVGLLREIHRRPARLSGGQQQRVAVARALVGNPSILLADEPTAALDQKTATALLDQLVSLAVASSAAVLIATHDPRSMARSDRVLTLENGKLAS